MATRSGKRKGVRVAFIVFFAGTYVALAAYFLVHTLSTNGSVPPAPEKGQTGPPSDSAGELERLRAELRDVKKEIQDERTRAARAEELLQEQKPINEALQAKLKEIFTQAKENESSLANLTREKKDLEQSLTESQNKVLELEKKLSDETGKRQSAEKGASELSSEKTTLSQKLGEKEQELDRTMKTLKESQNEAASLKEKIDTLQKELEKLRGSQ